MIVSRTLFDLSDDADDERGKQGKRFSISTTPEIDSLLAINSPVAIGISGGKDSSAVAVATIAHLDSIGHIGPRILIHADLGMTEWQASLPMCEELGRHLDVPLVVVRRAKGGMMERWEQRWSDNVARYANLECVKLILPWSTPDMRFCTSELKVAPICQELVRRFPGQTILNVTGIRRQESDGRKNSPIAKAQPKLTSKVRIERDGKKCWETSTTGIDWHPIVDWSLDDVLEYLESRGVSLHEAYTKYGLSRVSCAFCIMQSHADRLAATACTDNHDLYRRMVDLEARSTFAFQGDSWLADTAPHLLSSLTLQAIEKSKAKALIRQKIESVIPKHLLYTKGWPTCVPTYREAVMLCDVRCKVSSVIGIDIDYVEPRPLIWRYEELYEEKHGQAV